MELGARGGVRGGAYADVELSIGGEEEERFKESWFKKRNGTKHFL